MSSSFYQRPTYQFPPLKEPVIEIVHVHGQPNVAAVILHKQDESAAEMLNLALQMRPEREWSNVRREQPADPNIKVQICVNPNHTVEDTLIATFQEIDTFWNAFTTKMSCALSK